MPRGLQDLADDYVLTLRGGGGGGGGWCCLYNGPFWSIATVKQGAAKHLGKTTWAIQYLS